MFKFLLIAALLPPGIFLWPLAVGLVLLWRQRPAAKYWLLGAFIAGWVLSAPITSRILGSTLIAAVQPPELIQTHQPDLIVVLTGGIEPAGQFGWLPSRETFKRLAVGFQLQEQHGLRIPVVVSGGFNNGVKNPSEAAAALNFYSSQRAQITPVIVEDTSTNTHESALQVAVLIKSRGAENVQLVTSELHMLRALASYRARGIDPEPAMVPSLARGHVGLSHFLPQPRGVENTAKVLYEFYGLAQYVLLGRIKWQDLAYK